MTMIWDIGLVILGGVIGLPIGLFVGFLLVNGALRAAVIGAR